MNMNKLLKLAKLTLKNPRLAGAKIAVTWRNGVTAKWDYHVLNGRARPPATICIKLTNACNLRCKMCGQPREGSPEDSIKFAPQAFFRQTVAIDRYLQLLDEVRRFRPNIYLWGGEPFMYADIFTLIRYAKKNGLVCQVNTNGMYIKKYSQKIVDSGLDDIIISIDGPAAVHDQVRGLAGTFKLMEAGIKALQQEKQKRNVQKPVIRIRGTVSPENFEHIYSLTEIARGFGADSLNFNWTWFTTHETGEAHQRLMKHLFGINAISWRPFETDVIMDPEKRRRFDGIRTELKKLQNNNEEFLITMSPVIKPEQVESYYTDIRNTFSCDRCYSVWVKSYVLPNGDITPCPDYPDYIAGNLLQNDFMDIWNGEKYVLWRQELKKHKLFPVCYRCCDLFLSHVGVL
jgi:radical SAM protein with 4Fe4S-binding SPASM domain